MEIEYVIRQLNSIELEEETFRKSDKRVSFLLMYRKINTSHIIV